MNEVLEIKMEGWTATPRMPFILSGTAICLPTPTYSLLLGVIGCCMGRLVTYDEVKIGFHYSFESNGNDLETRQRLEFDGMRIKQHTKGTDAYPREFHVLPRLTLWLNRLDWKEFFMFPIGTPALGRSQDLLKITSVRNIQVNEIKEASIEGCMIPFSPGLKVSGQLVQAAEAYEENDLVGSGRKPTKSRIFMSIPHDNQAKIIFRNLFETPDQKQFYLHDWV